MDDPTAFDRLLASEVLRDAGPSGPVNDAAVFMAIQDAATPPASRFRSTFGLARFALAGAIVALFGGVVLVTQSPDPPGASGPAVQRQFLETDPVEVSVELTSTRECDEPDGGLDCRYTATSDDPRLEGVATETANSIWYPEDFHQYDMLVYSTHAFTIENAGGVWRSPPMYEVGWDLTRHDPPVERISDGDHGDLSGSLVLVGEGGYDGLVAVLRSQTLDTNGDAIDDADLRGFIVEGDIPPAPDDAYGR